MDKNKNKLKAKHIIGPPIAFLVVFLFLYSRMKGVSGGDIALSAFSVIFSVAMTLLIGLATFPWEFKRKMGLILGLVLSYLLAFICFALVL